MFEAFKEHTYRNTPTFAFQAANPWMRVVDVHDGDSVKVIVEAFPSHFVKADVRLVGIDTCEMTSTVPEIKTMAIHAKNRLIELLTGKTVSGNLSRSQAIALLEEGVHMVHVEVMGMDKYGRILGVLRHDAGSEETINAQLIREHLAVIYDGGHKDPAAINGLVL